MFNIDDDNNIELTRGDTAYIDLELTDGNGKEYVPEQGEELIFTVKSNPRFCEALLQKPLEGLRLKLDSADTECLSFGNYWYDIQLTMIDGGVHTVVGPAKIKLCKDITW